MCGTGSKLNTCIVIIIGNDNLQLCVTLNRGYYYVLMTVLATL